MIVLDASAAIEIVLDRPSATVIREDVAATGPVLVPAHFEADAYSGLRRMVNTGVIGRGELPAAIQHVADMPGERVPLAPLLRAAYQLFDQVGAHDSFYVALALALRATLLTSDAPLARAAEQLGVSVLLRRAEVAG